MWRLGIAKVIFAFLATLYVGSAQAQWKTIPCSELKFTVPVQLTSCEYEFNASREIYVGYFHDATSSLAVAVYTAPGGMRLQPAEDYALGCSACRSFRVKSPSRSELVAKGKWLAFPSTVKAPSGDRPMNCLQFFKGGPPGGAGYRWTMVALMCVNNGDVPEAAADLILNGIQVHLK